jgi:hypothetical protein
MRKIIWGTGLLVSIIFAQTEYISLRDNSHVFSKTVVLQADSSVKRTSKPSHDFDIDELQERLYAQIISEINNPKSDILHLTIKDKNQLIEICQQYYPKAKLNGDTLIIPYPPQKVEKFKQIRYLIPPSYFEKNSTITSLQPQIELYLNPDKSTLLINNTYFISLYRSPRVDNSSIRQYKKILQYIFNLLLPYTYKMNTIGNSKNKTIVYYKGYKEHTIHLESAEKFYAFWESLCGQGALYFFPSKIDDIESSIIVHGLLYVMKDGSLNIYHFGELKVMFSKQYLNAGYEIQLNFYPFVIDKQIEN